MADRIPEVEVAQRTLYMRLHEVAELLGVGPTRAKRWTRRNNIRYYTTPGGERRYLRDSVTAAMEVGK